jgi:endonuclease/exonuclease/phosphatase family metal-dependent hydrolase
MNVRCLTINVAGLGFGWFEQRGDALKRGVERLAPDVLCLQEALVRNEPTLVDQVLDVAAATGLGAAAFAPYGSPGEPQGGVAIASRWPIRHVESRALSRGPRDPSDERVALFATLAAPGLDVHVANTHLPWRPEEARLRQDQMARVLRQMRARGWLDPGAASLVACDLNAEETEPVYAIVTAELQDTWRLRHPEGAGVTWCNDTPYAGFRHLPSRRLDYIFAARAARVVDAAVVLDAPDPVYPSDHFGVFAVVDF